MIQAFNSTLQAAIFDLDGVIVDTAKYHYLAWKRLAFEIGVDLTVEHNERLKGVSRMESLDIIVSLAGISVTQQEKVAFAERKNGWFIDYVNQMTTAEILPGSKELVVELKNQGLKIGLGSSSKNASLALRILQIEPLFDAIADGTMIRNSKPHPEIFLLAASLLKTEPKHCVVFEDAEAGIEAALAAGMKCVGIGSPTQLHKANLVVPNLINFSFENDIVLSKLKQYPKR
jgi:beta-phosphoglucomutase